MITFKIGILGTGSIAEKIADTIIGMGQVTTNYADKIAQDPTIKNYDGFELYAVGSRTLDKAKSFANKFHMPKAYGSYEELANDPDIDLIYIATPHSLHAENAKLCINAGKPVLVEKPFSYNAATAEEVIKLAREKKVFCAEAMWLSYMPIMKFTCGLIREGIPTKDQPAGEKKPFVNGIIGDLRLVTANLGYDLRGVKRLNDPELAGGALLDLGVYPLTAVFMILQQLPVSMASASIKTQTGVDAIDTVSLNFQNGKMATIYTSMMGNLDNEVRIYGNNGYIVIDNVNCPTNVKIYKPDGSLLHEINAPSYQYNGYEYEFIAAREAIIRGQVEVGDIPHSNSLNLLRITDSLRKTWKVSYPLPGEVSPENA